jgi:hypothetical protein
MFWSAEREFVTDLMTVTEILDVALEHERATLHVSRFRPAEMLSFS